MVLTCPCLYDAVVDNRDELAAVLESISANGKGLLQRNQVLEKVAADSKLLRVLSYVQEAVVLPPVVGLALRPPPGIMKCVSVDTANDLAVTDLSVFQFQQLIKQANGERYESHIDVFGPDDDRCLEQVHPVAKDLLLGGLENEGHEYMLYDRNKPIIFMMARLDKANNLSGLVGLFGSSKRLRELVNLVVVSHDHRGPSRDGEEQEEYKKMHDVIQRYALNGSIRWISQPMDHVRNGELYRVVADTKGAFVQPSVYEAFDLPIVQAMATGLPTFATLHRATREIIVNGVSGFHIDPNKPDQVAWQLVDFFEKCKEDPTHWDTISQGGIKKMEEKLKLKHATRDESEKVEHDRNRVSETQQKCIQALATFDVGAFFACLHSLSSVLKSSSVSREVKYVCRIAVLCLLISLALIMFCGVHVYVATTTAKDGKKPRISSYVGMLLWISAGFFFFSLAVYTGVMLF